MHPQGLEPWTHWLRVSCSTNWAKDAYLGDNYASCGRCRSLDILNDHCWSFNSACAWSGRRCGRFRDNLRCEPLRVCDCIALHCVKPNPVNRLLDFKDSFSLTLSLLPLERETGFGPATFTLARWHSTTESLPQAQITISNQFAKSNNFLP